MVEDDEILHTPLPLPILSISSAVEKDAARTNGDSLRRSNPSDSFLHVHGAHGQGRQRLPKVEAH